MIDKFPILLFTEYKKYHKTIIENAGESPSPKRKKVFSFYQRGSQISMLK